MKPNTTPRGGGVALVVRNYLPFIERPDLNVHENINFDCIFIELSNKEFGNKVVAVIYRPLPQIVIIIYLCLDLKML